MSEREQSSQCWRCGHEMGISVGQAFCTACGSPTRTQLSRDPLPTELPAPPPCRGCGAPNELASEFCTRCGLSATPTAPVQCDGCSPSLAAGMAFCTKCGQPVRPVQVPMGVSHDAVDGPRPPMFGVAAVALAAGLLALVAWFAIRGGDEVDHSSVTGVSDSGGSTPGTALGENGQGEGASETSTGGSNEKPFRCWTGRRVPNLNECTTPTGREGLAYIFPAMSSQRCQTISSTPQIGRSRLVKCFDLLPSGERITINYSQWRSVALGRAHYGSKLPGGGLVNGSYVWRGPVNGEYNIAGQYANAPFSVSVYGPSEAKVLEALTSVVRARPPAEIRGTTASQ